MLKIEFGESGGLQWERLFRYYSEETGTELLVFDRNKASGLFKQ